MPKKGCLITKDEAFYLTLEAMGYNIEDALDNPYPLIMLRNAFTAGMFFGENSVAVMEKRRNS